jgi:ABC-type oligopeptide transport system substrate-binding subunit
VNARSRLSLSFSTAKRCASSPSLALVALVRRGSPLTAERFHFANERACDPNTAAVYASILFDIVGCEALYTSLTAPESPEGSATPVSAEASSDAAYETAKAALGVRAIDDRTLEVRLTNPAPYFPTVASTWVFYPVKQESLAAGDAWAQDPTRRIGNGPFRMTDFAGDQLIGFAANEHYWAGARSLMASNTSTSTTRKWRWKRTGRGICTSRNSAQPSSLRRRMILHWTKSSWPSRPQSRSI